MAHMLETQEVVNILWTGGWDSTFRMIQLASRGASVQPFYVIDTNRLSSLKELKQIDLIRKDLLLKYADCRIADVKLLVLDAIVVDSKFPAAFERLNQDSMIGSQYVWLAALAEQIPNLELSIHRDDKAEYFVRKLLKGEKGPESDEHLIFGNLKCPILEYTKLDMEKEAEVTRDTDILYKSWFCHSPVNNTPCGFCNPCLYSIEEGMSKRFTLRGRLYSKAPRLFHLIRFLVRKFI